MTKMSRTTTLAAALALISMPALAQVTADQVTESLTQQGYTNIQVAPEQAYAIDFVTQPFGKFDAGKMGFWRFALETGVGQAGIDQVVEFVKVAFHHFPQALTFGMLVRFL